MCFCSDRVNSWTMSGYFEPETKFLKTVRAPGCLDVESSLKRICDSSYLIEWLARLRGLAPENRVVRWNPGDAETSTGRARAVVSGGSPGVISHGPLEPLGRAAFSLRVLRAFSTSSSSE